MKTNNIEFIEDGHYYLNEDGIIIPSVSQLIKYKFPSAYSGVPDEVLKKKASYGTRTHEAIERFIKGEYTLEELKKKNIDPNIKVAVEQFELLRKTWAFQIKEIEQIVSWNGKYAGTFDLLTLDDYLIDIKTTSELHMDWLQWQLSLYAMAKNLKHDFHFCMWFPKGKMGKVVQVNVLPREECEELVRDYYRDLETDQRL